MSHWKSLAHSRTRPAASAGTFFLGRRETLTGVDLFAQSWEGKQWFPPSPGSEGTLTPPQPCPGCTPQSSMCKLPVEFKSFILGSMSTNLWKDPRPILFVWKEPAPSQSNKCVYKQSKSRAGQLPILTQLASDSGWILNWKLQKQLLHFVKFLHRGPSFVCCSK